VLETAQKPSAARSATAARAPRLRARRTNNPLAGFDLNTAGGRRVADLTRAYLSALGNPTDIERQAAVIQAAELQVLAEEARTAALKDTGSADLDQLVRLQGAADRAVRRLGLKPGASRNSGPDLAAYLAAIAAQEPVEAPEEVEAAEEMPEPDSEPGEIAAGDDEAAA